MIGEKPPHYLTQREIADREEYRRWVEESEKQKVQRKERLELHTVIREKDAQYIEK